jgi:hypothetical protein
LLPLAVVIARKKKNELFLVPPRLHVVKYQLVTVTAVFFYEATQARGQWSNYRAIGQISVIGHGQMEKRTSRGRRAAYVAQSCLVHNLPSRVYYF